MWVRWVGDDVGQGDDVEAAIRGRRVRHEQPLDEEIPELLVVAVQLTVGGNEGEGRATVGERRADQSRGDALSGEPIRVRRRLGLERGGGRQPGIEEDDADRPAGAEIDAVGSPGVDAHVGGLPRGEDRIGDSLLGRHPQRGQVDRRLRQPQPARPQPETDLEFAKPPADLGSSIRRGGERQDRVMKGLGHRVAACGRGREVGERRRVFPRQPAAEGWPQVPRHLDEVAALRVWSVALRVDAGIPVVERRRGQLGGDHARPRIDPGGLIEMAVDGEAAARHRLATTSVTARSAVTPATCSTRRFVRSPGASRIGRRARTQLPW